MILFTAIFAAICIFFFGKVIYMQLNAPEKQQSSELSTRTLTVKAIRGEIYDRNGNKLVANRYSYSVYLDGGSFNVSNQSFNGALVKLNGILGEKLEIERFPITGDIKEPYYKDFDSDSAEYSSFMKMLDRLELPRNTDAQTLFSTLCQRYGLIDSKKKYTVEENTLMSVMAIRYEAERLDFGALNPYTLAKDLTEKEITAVEESGITGVAIEKTASRVYNYPGYASHILGRTGKIQSEDLEYYTEKGYSMDAIVGIDGAEKAFEEYLRGIDGTLVIVEDKEGNVVDQYYKKEPIAGKDVYLTVDIELQKTAEDTLSYNVQYIRDKAIAKIKQETEKYTDPEGNITQPDKIPKYIGEDVTSGAAVLMNPNNGEIYALASYPTFDLSTYLQDYNDLLKAENSPLFNRALMGVYEPGSTFKISVAAAALEYGLIDRSYTLFDGGVYKFYNDFQPECWIYTSHGYGHGNVNVISAIQHSCNYFFYDVGRQLTIEKLNSYCKTLGLGEYTGVELPEAKGILAGPEYSSSVNKEWVPGDTVQASIGQSDNNFTPLQIASYLSSIVNGGSRYKAHLLHSVRSFGGEDVIVSPSSEVLNTVELSDENLQILKTGMRNVMENGTAAPVFADYPLEIGGKTGTAQVGKTRSNNGIFMAFAPFDKPEIVASCIIEQGGESNDCSVTIKGMFNKYFNISR